MHDLSHTKKNLMTRSAQPTKLEPKSSVLVKPNFGQLYNSELYQY